MSDLKKSILMNAEVIAVNQDPLFRGGSRLYKLPNGAQVIEKGSARVHGFSLKSSFGTIRFRCCSCFCVRACFFVGALYKRFH